MNMKKYLYLATPFATIWAVFTIAHFIPMDDKQAWFWIPYFLSSAGIVAGSIFIAACKTILRTIS
jgi:hypothetical protein